MENNSENETIVEGKSSLSTQSETNNENPDTQIWSPAYSEFCFGDSPDEINAKLPKRFASVEWDRLPIADEYQIDEVRYFFLHLNAFDNIIKFIPPDEYVSPLSYVCIMFTKKKLFRLSVRLFHDDRAKNYRSIVESYARAVNTPLLPNGMFHYEDQRIFYYSSDRYDHTVIETIEKQRVVPTGTAWNPFPSNNISQKTTTTTNLSNSTYSYDFMISYCHRDKDICHKISHKLIEDGFKVWVDLENMYGSTIARMAEGIENCQFVIICMSNGYQSSPYCQTEGEYTYKLQRSFIPLIVEKDFKPKGWLGALVGLRMYIDFTKFQFDEAYQKLITEIKRNKKQE